LSAGARDQIKAGSWSVDNPLNGGQNTSHSNEHGMTIPGQSPEQAAENADQFINTNVDRAQAERDGAARDYPANRYNDMLVSFFYFGRAFHTVSDMTSPAHEGYQVWYASQLSSHMAAEASISNFRMGLAVGATLSLYRYTYGQQALEQATGYTPGSQNDPSIKAIRAQYELPGQHNDMAEAEALHSYRLGLKEGLRFDWHDQWGRRGQRPPPWN
jgi:hypothetical protein